MVIHFTTNVGKFPEGRSKTETKVIESFLLPPWYHWVWWYQLSVGYVESDQWYHLVQRYQ